MFLSSLLYLVECDSSILFNALVNFFFFFSKDSA